MTWAFWIHGLVTAVSVYVIIASVSMGLRALADWLD